MTHNHSSDNHSSPPGFEPDLTRKRGLHRLDWRPSLSALGDDFGCRASGRPLRHPQLLHFNTALAAELGLSSRPQDHSDLLSGLNSQTPIPGTEPFASVYAGHQFGVAVPQLGDGRALSLGVVADANGRRQELQLKGAGPTPFSRGADGRAVLRSSLREHVASEALHGLGIPTTRSLCLIGSDEPVQRETMERGALILRCAPSFIRFGHFEYFAWRGQTDALQRLADHVLTSLYPHCADQPQPHGAWLSELGKRTADLVARWQVMGFCHGVMNTDNFSILGQTIDYGPFGFLDRFDPDHICNHSDHSGRYAYRQQPQVAHWNLSRLYQACLPLWHTQAEAAVERANDALAQFPQWHADAVLHHWSLRLGLRAPTKADAELLQSLLGALQSDEADFHISIRSLSAVPASGPLPETTVAGEALRAWQGRYQERLRQQAWPDEARRHSMDRVNPIVIARNHLLQQTIDAAEQGQAEPLAELMRTLERPCLPPLRTPDLASPAPPWARCLSVSCSS